MNKTLAIIPARGGSKGIPKKNIKYLNGKPLIYWTISAALKSKLIDKVVVSSDSRSILKLSKKFGAETLSRPKKISGDKATTESAVKHCIDYYKNKYETLILLAPTSPLKTSKDIDNALKLFKRKKLDSCFSGAKLTDFLIWNFNKKLKKFSSINYDYKNRGRRQNRKLGFVENGCIYIFKPWLILKKNNRIGGRFDIFEMNFWQSFEIDEKDDWKLIETMHKVYILNKNEKK